MFKNSLINITFSDQNNHKCINDINLGSECGEYLRTLVNKGHADVIQNIWQNCLQFYIITAEEIKKRLPINDMFLYKLRSFQPHVALFDCDRETYFSDVFFIAKSLSSSDKNG